MYRPDAVDMAIIQDRAHEYRDQVGRRLDGSLSEDGFRALRLMNGLYLQLHAYMLRVAIPFGSLSGDQLAGLSCIARKYDRAYAHVTTRQNIQFNWLKLKDTPDLFDDLAAIGLHAIQTSGSCVRAITVDPHGGFEPDEVADPRHLAEALRRWSSMHPEFTYLPRKFKFAITGLACHDRSSLRVHDLGIELIKQDGDVGARIWAGGGMGRGPAVGVVVVDYTPLENIFGWVEAILRVYNAAGRRDHLYKSRIKILVASMGQQAFRAEVEKAYQASLGHHPILEKSEMAAIIAAFNDPKLDDASADILPETKDIHFAQWLKRNVTSHRAKGYGGVYISLKSTGNIPGDMSSDQMDVIADLARQYSHNELRTTQNQNLILPYVRYKDLEAVYLALKAIGLNAANIGLASDITSCPGMDYCQLATARSIPLAQAMSERLAALEWDEAIGALNLKISGCVNACAHHHVADIGILGVDKLDTDYHQISVGGRAGNDARLAQIISKAITTDEALDAVEHLLKAYLDQRIDEEETFALFTQRVGVAALKEIVHASPVA